VIDNFNAAEIGAHLAGSGAHFLFVAENRNTRESFARGDAGGGYRPRIFAFGQNYALGISGGALANLIEDTHVSDQ
jgi:hypothetical protein